MLSQAHPGEVAALTAAGLWAISSVLYGRAGGSVPPLRLNLIKGVLAIGMLLLSLVLRREPFVAFGWWSFAMLALSGAIGIGVGDTAFFAALNRMGARRTVLMAETLAPPLAATIALGVLSESLSLPQIIGMAFTITGVGWVLSQRDHQLTQRPRRLNWGLGWGLLSALCQAVGAVLSRAALVDTEIDPFVSALVRIASGVALLALWLLARGQRLLPANHEPLRVWRTILAATLLGTFLGIVLQQTALQHTDTGVAQTLMATSSLFVLPIVALRGERITLRACLGAGVAVLGVAVLLLVG